jgi:hypothetical protein
MPSLDGQIQVMKMDDRGRVVEMGPGGDLTPEAEQLVDQVGGGGLGMELPENAVGPGDTWTAQLDFGAPTGAAGETTLVISVTYTLVEVGASDGSQVATIAFEGPIALSTEAGMEATGTMSGTMVFDVTRGRIMSTDSEVNVDMGSSGMAMSMNQTMSMRLIGS